MDANRVRRRRSPEQARAEILAAATDLIAARGPDGVTLAQVAAAAGVTRGLVSHYFGTYRALVGEVLRRANERHRRAVRDRLAADRGVPYARGILDVLFEAMADEQYIRLWTWAQLRAQGTQVTEGALTGLVEAMESGLREALPEEEVPGRERIEEVVLLAMSGAYGYALGGRAWQVALGHEQDSEARDQAFQRTLTAAVAAYLVAGENG